MGSTTANTTSSRVAIKLEISASSRRPVKPGVLQLSRATGAETKRASIQGTESKYIAAGSPRRSSSAVYVPPGGRSPTATIKQAVKTYSLHSTIESRAAVAPRRKPITTKKPLPARDYRTKQDRPASAGSAATAPRGSIINASVSRCGVSQLVPSQQNQQQHYGFQLKSTRASLVYPHSPAPMLQKTKIWSTIIQQQERPDPVLVQVSRRTSSPILSPGGPGARRRPSVAPIGPASSPVRGPDAGPCLASPGSSCSPRTSISRRDNKLEKLQEQVNVLKASLGISDEDLHWKVESAKGNAFLAADRHLAACEERYDRLSFEMQELSQPARCATEDKANVALAVKLRALEKQAQQVADLKATAATYQAELVQTKKDLLAARVEAELQRATQDTGAMTSTAELELTSISRLESIKETILSVQQQLKTEQGALQMLLEWLGSETDRFSASFAAETLSHSLILSDQAAEAKRSLLATLQTIPECAQGSERFSSLCSQAAQLAATVTACRAHDLKRTETELERTMRDVEMWKTRREQAKEFLHEMREREAAWQTTQRDKNDECIALMRTFIPSDIAELSVETLIARAQQGTQGAGSGVLYTYDLATYLKTNRLLHWLVMHEDDIARANFLANESAPFFMDFASYDIQELRALARVLPDTFTFDKDGRKNAWRTAFLDHVRQLAAQQQHETIKAGWDPVKRTRREVPLPELTARQQLNPIFCYPTDAEMEARLDKFERQRARLEAKRVRLKKLDEELIPQAKAEYVALAEDARNEDLQCSFGKTTLIALRGEAKQQHLVLCKEKDALKGELTHGERAWAAMTPSFEQYQAEVAQIRALDPETRNAPRIRGPFPAEIDVQPRERAAFKKLSVEEEAEARKQELDTAIAQRSHDMNEVAVIEEVSIGPKPVEFSTNVVVSGEASLDEAQTEATGLMQREDKPSIVATGPSVTSEILSQTAPPLSRGFQRVKSLQVAVGVLQFLEKDFCSPKRALRGNEGSSLTISRKTAASEAEETEENTGKQDEQVVRTPRSLPSTRNKCVKEEDTTVAKTRVVVQPKSKALLKLLEARKAEETGTSPKVQSLITGPRLPSPFGGGQINFLGELQNRLQLKSSNAEAVVASSESEQANTSTGARKTINFLDELKRKAGGGDASSDTVSKKPMNILDELKSASTRKVR